MSCKCPDNDQLYAALAEERENGNPILRYGGRALRSVQQCPQAITSKSFAQSLAFVGPAIGRLIESLLKKITDNNNTSSFTPHTANIVPGHDPIRYDVGHGSVTLSGAQMHNSPPASTTSSPAVHVISNNTRTRGARLCGICRQPGHNRSTCSRRPSHNDVSSEPHSATSNYINVTSTASRSKRSSASDGVKGYIPKYRSGGWAILIALERMHCQWEELYRQNNINDTGSPSSPPPTDSFGLTKAQICVEAEPWTDIPMKGVSYCGWTSMSTLLRNGMVTIVARGPQHYALSEEGRALSRRMMKIEQLRYAHRKRTMQQSTTPDLQPYTIESGCSNDDRNSVLGGENGDSYDICDKKSRLKAPIECDNALLSGRTDYHINHSYDLSMTPTTSRPTGPLIPPNTGEWKHRVMERKMHAAPHKTTPLSPDAPIIATESQPSSSLSDSARDVVVLSDSQSPPPREFSSNRNRSSNVRRRTPCQRAYSSVQRSTRKRPRSKDPHTQMRLRYRHLSRAFRSPLDQWRIVLLVDSRECQNAPGQTLYSALQKQLGPEGVETRTLAIGDFVWVAKRIRHPSQSSHIPGHDMYTTSASTSHAHGQLLDTSTHHNQQHGLLSPRSSRLVMRRNPKLARLMMSCDEVLLNLIFERKRLDDLMQSIKQGRFLEQATRLRTSGISRIGYIVEKMSTPTFIARPWGRSSHTISRGDLHYIDEKAALTAQVGLSMHNNMIVYNSDGIIHTVNYLVTCTRLLHSELRAAGGVPLPFTNEEFHTMYSQGRRSVQHLTDMKEERQRTNQSNIINNSHNAAVNANIRAISPYPQESPLDSVGQNRGMLSLGKNILREHAQLLKRRGFPRRVTDWMCRRTSMTLNCYTVLARSLHPYVPLTSQQMEFRARKSLSHHESQMWRAGCNVHFGKQLLQVPGVSANKALAVLSKYTSWAQFYRKIHNIGKIASADSQLGNQTSSRPRALRAFAQDLAKMESIRDMTDWRVVGDTGTSNTGQRASALPQNDAKANSSQTTSTHDMTSGELLLSYLTGVMVKAAKRPLSADQIYTSTAVLGNDKHNGTMSSASTASRDKLPKIGEKTAQKMVELFASKDYTTRWFR